MEQVEELTCQELVELVTEYIEGQLESAERARFEQHMTACEGCRNYVEQMRHTIDLLGSFNSDLLQDPARQKLLGAFRDWKRRRA